MLDLSRQYASIRAQVLAAVERVCDSQRYILSDEVAAFESEFAALCGVQYAVGCASGTDALWLALAAAGIGPGHQVITTPFSFFATASAITRTGAVPVFADIDPETLNLDPASVEKKLKNVRSRMRAILPVHLYGQCADMDRLNQVATTDAADPISHQPALKRCAVRVEPHAPSQTHAEDKLPEQHAPHEILRG